MRINHNISALNAYRALSVNNTAMAKTMEKLSSGFRINRASDDAAGLAISEKMRAQIRGLAQAQRNAQDGISLIQTAEGALSETHALLQRIRELAVQAANDTSTNDDRLKIQNEVDQLLQEITRIKDQTEFNTKKLLNGSLMSNKLHIGANKDQNIVISIGSMGLTALGISGLKVSTQSKANSAIALVDAAIQKVSAERSKLGAYQNRLEHAIAYLGAAEENLTASESRIRDADMAKEMVEFTKNNILVQAAQAMLAQANQVPQGVLQLLR